MRKILLILCFSLPLICSAKTRIIHVMVALCDNKSQGIVPVPEKIGNGDDPDNNLYWGCGYGVRTFFKKSTEWTFISKRKNVSPTILERVIFKHKTSDAWLVADAYKGDKIKVCNEQFFRAAAGQSNDTVMSGETIVDISKADLVCYIGHDGLMDFSIDPYPAHTGTQKKDVIILACSSRSYYKEGIQKAGANPVLWTTNLMCPEAYTLKAALDGWLLNETGEQIRTRAAQAYDKYLKCGIKGARGLLVSGF